MADNTPPAEKTKSIARCVQEISSSSKEPPRRYCYRDGIGVCSDIPVMEIAVIDIDLLESPCPNIQELDKLRSALSSFGCFMAINHGMTSSFLDKVRLVSKQFFALPMEEKQKYAKNDNSREGYGDEVVYAENQVLDWNDRLILGLCTADQQQVGFWPKNPANFMETVLEYTTKLQLITKVVLKAMAMSLNLDNRCFLDKYGDKATLRLRFNLFPPCSRHNQVLGLKPHSDASAITIVLQDKEVEGLQILKDDQWFQVPVVPEALLINIGDQIEIMSNGSFKSPIHRVVINPEKERFSLAVFCLPDPDTDIEPVDGSVNDARPRLYKKVNNYVSTFLQFYYQGKRLIDHLNI
ncbi:2-oxoglutarate-dependent dioxygenase 11-like [Mercurialis annua]|uniref:2-oxoglutarate-dependent dioxygenase 11-like n=1 Tax=Mercurialis annua TaxID=3986 RepID=UPI00216075A2|nr:2-oxoglutarate-dependent dioxygenase 11-like [Mercurialis annua]